MKNIEKSKIVAIDVKRTVVTGVISVTTLSGTDIGSLKSGGTGNINSAEVTYTLVANGVTIFPCDSNGIPLVNSIDQFDANAIGSVTTSVVLQILTLIPAGTDISVSAHYVDNTPSNAWSILLK